VQGYADRRMGGLHVRCTSTTWEVRVREVGRVVGSTVWSTWGCVCTIGGAGVGGVGEREGELDRRSILD
jgi:hypothetical protein